MLHVSKWATGTCAIVDTKYLESKLAEYCNLCQLHLFCDIVQLQYVGTKPYDTHRMLHSIYLDLSGWNVCQRLTDGLFPLHPTPYTDVIMNACPLFPPMMQLCLLVLLLSYITHWALNYRNPSDLSNMPDRISQLLSPSLLKPLLYKSWEKNMM